MALGNAVIGNHKEKSGAPDDITPAKKGPTGKSCDMDLSSVRWPLHRAYVYHSLRLVPEASNNREVMDLKDAFKDVYHSLRLVPEAWNNREVMDLQLALPQEQQVLQE